jgi:uncharacterized protein YbjT (DUF2867 family)
MAKILITGGTGNLGKSLIRLLSEKNIQFIIGSRSNKSGVDNVVVMDLLKNEGIKEAVEGKEIIFHLATDPKNDTIASQNLLNAIDKNSNVQLIYISIVGIDKVPLSYYKQKLASENAIKASGIPYTILRATQFHELIHQVISTALKFPVGLLPKKMVSQPISTEVVAQELYRLSLEKAENRTYEIGGAEILTVEQMAEEWLRQTGKKRWILNFHVPGTLGKSLRNGSLATKYKKAESTTWKQWLTRQYNL